MNRVCFLNIEQKISRKDVKRCTLLTAKWNKEEKTNISNALLLYYAVFLAADRYFTLNIYSVVYIMDASLNHMHIK